MEDESILSFLKYLAEYMELINRQKRLKRDLAVLFKEAKMEIAKKYLLVFELSKKYKIRCKTCGTLQESTVTCPYCGSNDFEEVGYHEALDVLKSQLYAPIDNMFIVKDNDQHYLIVNIIPSEGIATIVVDFKSAEELAKWVISDMGKIFY